MKYLITIYGNDEVWTSLPPEVIQKIIAETDAHNQAMAATGELLFACGMADPATARKVSRDDAGATVVTDGPYLETKEHIGSFYIVDCEGPERALELAAQMPSATFREIEVWPIHHGGTVEDLSA